MIIIPARLKSTRFAEKILCDIKGLPMFVATAKRVSEVDTVCVAVDDEKVLSGRCQGTGVKKGLH